MDCEIQAPRAGAVRILIEKKFKDNKRGKQKLKMVEQWETQWPKDKGKPMMYKHYTEY